MTFKIWRDESVVYAKSGLSKSNVTHLPNGGYVVSWSDSNEGRIYLQKYDGAGQMVGTRLAVETVGDRQYDPEIQAYGSEGDFVVSWQESANASTWSVKSRIFKADGTDGTTQTLGTGLSIGDWERPAVAGTLDGGYITAFRTGQTNTGIQVKVHDKNGVVVATHTVTGVSFAEDVDITVVSDRKYVVSYSVSGSQYYRLMSFDGNHIPETRIGPGSQSDTVALKNDAGLPNGNFVVVYNEGSILRAKFASKDGVGVQISANGLNENDFVGATALRGGRIAVLFSEKVPASGSTPSDNGDIFLQIIEADGTLGPKTLINDLGFKESSQQKAPVISEMADGRLAITWHDPNYSGGSAIKNLIFDARIAPVIVDGTARNDIYYGTEYGNSDWKEILRGAGGNDKLYGEGGDDILNGGAGADSLYGGTGNDIADYFGSAGLAASLGGDFVNTGDAAGDKYDSIERLHGTADDDVLGGNAGANYIFGYEGNDWLYGGSGVAGDTLDGGGGFNSVTYEYSKAGVGITLDLSKPWFDKDNKSTGEAKDDVFTNIGSFSGTNYADKFIGSNEYNEFRGLKGDDSLIGGSQHDYLDGGDGSDTLEGGGGADDFVGGAGIDFASYENTTGGVTASLVSASQTTPSPNTGEAIGDTYNGIEGLIGGSGNDTLIGNDSANTLEGGAGADALNGGGGSDTVSYARSNAGVVVNLVTRSGSGGYAQSGALFDTYISIENVIGSNYNDTLIGDANANVLNGGAGIDTVNYSSSGAAVTVNLATGQGAGVGSNAQGDIYVGIENVVGSQFNDTLVGNGAANVFWGGRGDDSYYISFGDSVVENPGEGTDTVFADFNYTLGVNLESLTGVGSGALTLTGNELNNTIKGNAAGNWIDGGIGADTMIGGAGDDIYVIDNAGDVIIDNEGTNLVLLRTAYDLNKLPSSVSIGMADGINTPLTGTNGNNVLRGNAAANILKGQGGNDKIYGMTGNDRLYGGSGKDTFVFDTRLNKTKNVDKIYDFKSRDDTFHLDNAIFTKLGKGTPTKPVKFKSGMFYEGNKAHDKDDRIIYDKKTGNLYYDDDGSGRHAQVKFATITNKAKLYYHDFYVI